MNGTRSSGVAPEQTEFRFCHYCKKTFTPRRLRQEFCNPHCRKGFHDDVGATGEVAGVTRLKKSVSVVIHLPNGPAADRAIELLKGTEVRLVTK
jgi:hypothetical protein